MGQTASSLPFSSDLVRGVHTRASVERRSRETRETCLSRLAPSVTHVVICVSRAFCSTDQEKRETARSLIMGLFAVFACEQALQGVPGVG